MNIKIYKTIILSVVTYGCIMQSLTLREKCRLRVFENRILRWIFGSKRDEKGEWQKIQNGELHSSPNIVRLIKFTWSRWAGHVARMEEDMGAFKMLTCKHTRKRPLGRPMHTWEDNIRVDF